MVTVGNFCRGSWGYAIAEDLISTHHSCWRVGWHEELVIVAVSAEERSTWKGGGGVTCGGRHLVNTDLNRPVGEKKSSSLIQSQVFSLTGDDF